jgi:hypothetical protein
MSSVVLASHGARVIVRAPADLAATVVDLASTVATIGADGPTDAELVAEQRADGTWVLRGSATTQTASGADIADLVVDHLHKLVSVHARHVVFIHAGVVGMHDRVVIVPGRSHTGKTTLVAAAVRAGWHYYSDEFAVVDADGLIHPYPRPLGVRDESGRTHPVPVREFGGTAATERARAAAIVSTRFVAGTTWSPRIVEGSAAALTIVDNAVRARLDPRAVFRAAAAIVGAPTPAYVGARGDATEVVDRLPTLIEAMVR